MFFEGHSTGGRVNRLTPRQRRQVASLYGKAPKPMGTWEPLPSLTREETDIILKEFDQQTKSDEDTPVLQDHGESFPGRHSGIDRELQHRSATISTSHPVHDTGQDGTSNSSLSFSGPSSVQQRINYPSENERAGSEHVLAVSPHSQPGQYHPTQIYPHSQTVRAPSPNNATYSQYCGSTWTTTYESCSNLQSSQVYQYSSCTHNQVPSPSCTLTSNVAVSPVTTTSSGSTGYHSTGLLPAVSSSHENYLSSADLPAPPTTPQNVSQLGSDLTSLGITLNPSSIEDVSNVDHSLLVVGITGSGKSSACNFFIGQDVFDTAGGAIAVTAKSDAHTGYISGKQVLFIDTPGFGDEFTSDEVRMAELGRAILFAREGVDAIVLCIDGSRRFDSSIAQLLKEFEVLGAFWPYTFIVYTHAADMGKSEEERQCKISQWLSNPKCPERMKWLFDKVCHRCMTVESKQFIGNTGYYQQKSLELLNMIEKISAHNQHQRYTNQFFQWAKGKYDQVKQKKLEHERKLQETLKNLQSYQSIVKLVEEDLRQREQQYKEMVNKQQQYISSLEEQLRSCRDDERMQIQAERAMAQQRLIRQGQDHQRVVANCGAQKEQAMVKYDEDSRKHREHEWYSNRQPLEVFLDELRYELYASNRERRELSDKLAYMNVQLQKMQEEKARPQTKERSSMYDVVVDGAKTVIPTLAKSACCLM